MSLSALCCTSAATPFTDPYAVAPVLYVVALCTARWGVLREPQGTAVPSRYLATVPTRVRAPVLTPGYCADSWLLFGVLY